MSSTITPYTPRDGDSVLALFSLKGKTAIVTGAGAGIGWAVAEAYAEAGANVALWYNSNGSAVKKAEELGKKFNVQAKAYQVQVTSQEEVQKATDLVVSEFNNRLDIFVANAGIAWIKGPVLEAAAHDHYRSVMSTNLDSVYFSAFAAGQHFKRQGTGSFIATASISGHIVNIPQSQAVYNASKAAVIHLVKSLAVEWAGFARCNTVSPGYTSTEILGFVPDELRQEWSKMTPMRREGLANELKGAYLYFASDASTFTTGSELIVDGGYSSV